ncbi:DDE-type integrase/transposase/recombinase [Paraburkholderia azotifigens]|uniref:DDE-type integrase/transposase/recombinase n=1 Tax=Paraburkholderia azotifigens TaxID=2057004 RepID=UPI00317E2558
MRIELPVTLHPISLWKQNEMLWNDARPLGSAKPYSKEEMHAAFKEWGTPEAGQIYILESRTLAPTRQCSARKGNIVSRYTSRKMGTRLTTESKRVEFPAVVKADFDGFTHEIYCQPKQVKIPTVVRRFASSRGKVTEYTVEIPCTPDVLSLGDYGPFLDEWKTESELKDSARNNPQRFYKSEDGTWHCPEREAFFKEMGITYRVRSSEEHDDLFASNLEHLAAYLLDDARPVTEDAWSAIEKAVRKGGGAVSLAALNRLAYRDETPWNEDIVLPTPTGRFRLDDVLKAIADQLLFVDLYYDDLSDPYEVVVCSTPEQLEAIKWRRPPPHAVSEHFVLNADIGTEFMLRGRAEVFSISAMPKGKVFYRDTESKICEELPENAFQRMMLSRDIQLLSSVKTTAQLLAENPPVSDERVQKTRRRFELLKMLEQTDVPHVESVRTIQRWRAMMREAGDSRPLQMLALLPRRPGGRGRQIGDDVLSLVKEVALGANNPTNPSTANSFDEFKELCKDRGIKPCSKNTFYARSAQFRDIRAREGPRRAYNQEPAVWYLHRHDKIHGGRPFHRVHIDHTKLDIIIKIRGRGGRVYRLRPWLTVVIDAETRAVLAFYLAAHPPSTVSCMMALRAMVALHKRVPDFIVCDNGKEFHSKAFDKFCDMNDITIDYRPAHESRFGNVVERLFGVANKRLIHRLVGTSKATQHVRTLTRSVDPIYANHLNFVQLHGLLEHFFFVEYNQETPHPAHDHTPEQYMHNRFIETGRRLTRLRPYDMQFMLQTLIPVASNNGTRTVSPTMGVKVGPVWYWTDEFAATRHKDRSIPVYVDMWDVSVAYVIIRGQWHKCVSNLLLRYQKLTAIELRYVLYEVRLRLKATPDEPFQSVLDGVMADDTLPPAAAATAATRQIYGPAGLTAVSGRIDDTEMAAASAEAPIAQAVERDTEHETTEDAGQPQPSPSSRPSKYQVDYASLPIRHPVR